MRSSRSLVGLVVTFACLGCTGTGPTFAPMTDASPPIPTPRTTAPQVASSEPASPSPVPGSGRSCITADVAVGGVWWAGATGSVEGGVVVYSIAQDSCTIRGPIMLRVVANGLALPVQTTYLEAE